MAVLEQIRQMKQQGLQEDEITNRLQEQGISPKAINDALNQSKIKEAVTGEEMEEENNNYYEPTQTQNRYSPRTQDISEQNYGEEYSMPQQQEYYPQEGYENYSAGGTDLMIEVAEQIFMEKSRKMKKEIEELTEFASLFQEKIKMQEDRLKRIETIIDKMQIAILEKIGSYGENINQIKKEMSMMQDSFGKMIPELAKKHAHKK